MQKDKVYHSRTFITHVFLHSSINKQIVKNRPTLIPTQFLNSVNQEKQILTEDSMKIKDKKINLNKKIFVDPKKKLRLRPQKLGNFFRGGP